MILNAKTALAALLICTAATHVTGGAAPEARCKGVQRTAYLMGTLLRVSACAASEAEAAQAIEAAFAETARLEGVLSSWRPDSEIGRLNASPAHVRVRVGSELSSLLREAAAWNDATGGAFDPAVGALVDAWGFRGEPRVPAPAALEAALAASGWQRARLEGDALVRGPAGWWIDTGGFGKGAALRSSAAALQAAGVREAVLDFGGQLLVLGGPAAVEVAHPARRTESAFVLRVSGVSVATTSQSERAVEVDGARYGHVLDPRKGVPVPAWGSVTVVAADALAADALSTALFVLGPEGALAWGERHPEVGVLVLRLEDERVSAAWSRGLEQWIHPEGRDESQRTR